METQTLNQPVVFLDNVGRTIIGELVKEVGDVSIVIKNPALVHIATNPQTNQFSLQILPLFFKEFQADRSEPTVWVFNKNNITLSQPINLAPQFIGQYRQLFQMLEQSQNPAAQKEPEVVKLFDEEDSKK